MAEEETDAEFHARLLARSRAGKAKKLAKAKAEAEQRGKQEFDLDVLEQHYDMHIDGWLPERADRVADYEYRYYVTHADTMSLAEYAVEQKAIDAGGSPPKRDDPAQFAARADTLLARTPESLDGASALRIEQAKTDLAEAIGHLEKVLSFIPDGADVVPDAAFTSFTTKYWSEKHPQRYNRTELTASIAAERARLAKL